MAIKLTKKQHKELSEAIGAYENACSELSQMLTDILDEWQSEFDEKSEKWQESDAGQAAREKLELVQSWIDEMPNLEIDADQLVE